MKSRFHAWMENNLEEPFLKAEMVRTEPSEQNSAAAAKIQVFAAAGIVLSVCWLIVAAVK